MNPSQNEDSFVLIGIDPGTENIGVSIFYINALDLEITAIKAFTLVGSKLGMRESDVRVHGARFARLRNLENALYQIFIDYQPLCVGSESPFYNRLRPSAFEPLVESMCAIQNALARADGWKPLRRIDPPSVKKAFKASGRADKDEMKSCFLNSPLKSLLIDSKEPEDLDEHSIDAIAVARAVYQDIKEEILYDSFCKKDYDEISF
jgi:Holliday junction resolvasome RuvABC endonuclease subunit